MYFERGTLPKDLSIDTATLGQLNELTDFLQPIYAATYSNGLTITRDMFENDIFREHLRDYLSEKLTQPASTLLLARSDGKIRGTIGLAFDQADATTAEMWGFYVDPDLQSRGFGSVLYGSLMQDERFQRIKKLHLNVAKSSAKAINFYKKNGFTITGEEVWDWPSWIDNPPKNHYWLMEKQIRT